MKRIISKLLLAALLAAITCGSAFAASAKVTYVKGKVEVNRGDAWVSLKVGDEVNESETISTGFQSEARLNYNGSVMAVPALSRITLETLQSSGSKETVSLKVDTGAVRSKVTHTEGKRIEYTARTSVAVASVRGTDFAVFANGKAKVWEGAIAYFKISDFIPPVVAAALEEAAGSEAVEDEGSATATTSASDISSSSPKGSTVVGAGQTSTIGKFGSATKPIIEAIQRATQAKKAVASAAKKDTLNAAINASGETSAFDKDSFNDGNESSGNNSGNGGNHGGSGDNGGQDPKPQNGKGNVSVKVEWPSSGY